MKTITLKISAVLFAFIIVITSCKKAPSNDSTTTPVTTDPLDPGNGGATGSITAPTDPSVAATQGFFLDDWQPRTFAVPGQQTAAKPTANSLATVTADYAQVVSKVSKYMFGNNISTFTGNFTDAGLLANIKNLSPNIIRGPGGSISDVYFWNGTPTDVPDKLLNSDGSLPAGNTTYWSGDGALNWQMPIANYYNVLQQTNATGIITVNYAYARYGTGPHPVQTAAHLAADWVRHDNGRTKYWEVGNECYGNWEACYHIDVTKNQDHQPALLTGTLYGQQFKVFADSMRAAAAEIHSTIKIGAVLHEGADTNNGGGVSNWNADALPIIGNGADFYIIHNYYTNYNENSDAITIFNTAAAATQAQLSYVKTSLQNTGAPVKPIAQTEWNIFSIGSGQQISNVAGLHAVMTLGELIKQQVGEASRWDMMNGWSTTNPGDDQGLFSYNGQPNVPDFTPRPAFYYMYYFQKYFGDRMISSSVSGTSFIKSYASSFSSGQAGVVLVNESSADLTVSVKFNNFYTGANYYYYALKGGTDNGQFSEKVLVNGNGPSITAGGPSSYTTLAANTTSTTGGIKVTVPGLGAVFLVVDKKP